MTEKHAFNVPHSRRVLPIEADGTPARTQMGRAAARAARYTLHDWPTGAGGEPVDADELPDHLPAPETSIDPATVAKFERIITLRSSAEGRAQPEALEMILASNLPADRAIAFLRGLPATDTPSTSTIESERTMSPDMTKEDKLVEIKVSALSDRAARGDEIAKAKFRDVNRAVAVAASQGISLGAALKAMRITL